MIVPLILGPAALALCVLVIPAPRVRAWLVALGGMSHLGLLVFAFATGRPDESAFGGWLVVDNFGRIFLGLTSVLFAVCSLYAVGYLAERPDRDNRIFCAAMLVFLAVMTLMIGAHHLGLMWVALEACTLSTAPLIYFNRSQLALEAVYKYLLIGSVGIAIALLGSLFLAYGAFRAGLPASLLFEDLVREAPALSRPWLHAAFVLLFLGYGTKMGLAPMHTWKPDAYGEAPGVVGALLAGGLTSCAFLAVVRFFKICVAAGDVAFAREMMISAGLLSMAVGAVFMARQGDFKRMLAYSSVEQMGILVLGVGIGGGALFGALLHMVNNGLTKGIVFLSAGNLHRVYASKRVEDVTGAMRRVPLSGGLFLLGFFAVTGSPPFGAFQSEFTILRSMFRQGHFLVAGLFLGALAVVFIGMGATVLSVVSGRAPATDAASSVRLRSGPGTDHRRETWLTVAPIVALTALVLLLGVYVPPPVDAALRAAAAYVEAPGATGLPPVALGEGRP